MILTKLEIQNFKSFGNNLQTIEFDPDKGEVILLTGKNGAGKSSFKEAIEFVGYGKVKKRKSEGSVAKDKLANRYNKNLHVGAEFISADSKKTLVRIERDVKPDRLELWENHKPYDRIGKGNIDDKIQEHIGIDYKSFLSFISMNANDFKNFMSLPVADKRLLLDRLFNLDVINELKKVLNGLMTQNQLMLDGYQKELSMFDREITGLNKSIESLKSRVETNIKDEIQQIKVLMKSKKDEFIKLESKMLKLDSKKQELESMFQQESEQLQSTNFEIKQVTDQIKLYEAGKCPTCETSLTTETYLAYKLELIENKETLIAIRDSIKTNIKQYAQIEEELNTRNQSTIDNYNDIKYYLSDLRKKLDALKQDESDINVSDVNGMEEFFKLIEAAAERKETTEDLSMQLEKKKALYKYMDKVFGENGIKRMISANLVTSVNQYLKENLKIVNFPYYVILNDQFDAEITFLGEEMDPELLSEGETTKVNLSIMLSYLKIICAKRRINILFFDEVFSAIDIDSIEDIIRLFKDFSTEFKIVVFMVHHAQIAQQLFDRIIKVEKNMTTNITVINRDDITAQKIIAEPDAIDI